MKLYTYFRSTAAYRVRVAMNLKGLDCEPVTVDLLAGEQSSPAYRAINPIGLVPALETGQGVLNQSLAIIEYLDELHPEPALLPADPWQRAQVRSMAYAIACETHPLNNVGVLNFLDELGVDKDGRDRWYSRWIERSFQALEIQARGPYLAGESLTLADVCLVPQMFNARRFEVDVKAYPRLVEIDAALAEIDAFRDAHPALQPDAR
jgi:maleylacetoacetate isomerase